MNKALKEIAFIEKELAGVDEARYAADDHCQHATSMALIAISGYFDKMGDPVKERIPEVNWRVFKKTRNIAAHEYDALNPGFVWAALTVDIPIIKERIGIILQELQNDKQE